MIQHLILQNIQSLIDIKGVFLQWLTNSLIKKSTSLAWSETLAMRDKYASGAAVKSKIMSNQELAEELHEPIIRKFE